MSRESAADRTRFVCGFLGCDSRPFNPLLDSLPRIVHSPVSAQSRQWVASLIDAAVETGGGEAGAGREAMLAKLAELMFVEALRGHLAQLPDDERGWLAGVRHPQVGAALRLMHGRPADPWTLERLAREVGNVAVLIRRAVHHLRRIPPMQYLARWRLQLAARLLRVTHRERRPGRRRGGLPVRGRLQPRVQTAASAKPPAPGAAPISAADWHPETT